MPKIDTLGDAITTILTTINQQDMPEICQIYAQDMPQIFPRYPHDMHRYAKTCPRQDQGAPVQKTVWTV